jgi:type IV secretory pathway VirB2 component (pilin)
MDIAAVLPFVAVIWVTCAVVAYAIATAKGLHVIDALLTGIVGFFLGPIGVLIALADSPDNHV